MNILTKTHIIIWSLYCLNVCIIVSDSVHVYHLKSIIPYCCSTILPGSLINRYRLPNLKRIVNLNNFLCKLGLNLVTVSTK